jgi:hypothetical protein
MITEKMKKAAGIESINEASATKVGMNVDAVFLELKELLYLASSLEGSDMLHAAIDATVSALGDLRRSIQGYDPDVCEEIEKRIIKGAKKLR